MGPTTKDIYFIVLSFLNVSSRNLVENIYKKAFRRHPNSYSTTKDVSKLPMLHLTAHLIIDATHLFVLMFDLDWCLFIPACTLSLSPAAVTFIYRILKR